VVTEVGRALSQGKLVVYPTETAYGLGADATHVEAIARLLEFKGGRQNKAILVVVTNVVMVQEYVSLNEAARHLYDEFLPGPVTVISLSKRRVVRELESERQTLGIRMPDHPIAQAIIKRLGRPITATSANTSGQKTPYSLEDWLKYTSKKKQELVALFVDVGHLGASPPSTVVDTTLDEPEILRQGALQLTQAFQRESRSTMETQQVGKEIVEKYVDRLHTTTVLIALQGELGTGKTELTKGIARELKIKVPIISPTFQIMGEYAYDCGKVSGKLVHIDTWRLENEFEFDVLNVEKFLMPGTVMVIEWLEKVRGWIEKQAKGQITVVWVTMEGVGEEVRQIRYQEKK